MHREYVRDLGKRVLWWSKVKILYTRIALTRTTCAYFFIALVHCIILVALQSVVFADNREAQTITLGIISAANMTNNKFPVVQNGELLVCDSIPGQPGTTCSSVLIPPKENPVTVSTQASSPDPVAEDNVEDESDSDSDSDDEDESDSDSDSDDEDDDEVPKAPRRRWRYVKRDNIYEKAVVSQDASNADVVSDFIASRQRSVFHAVPANLQAKSGVNLTIGDKTVFLDLVCVQSLTFMNDVFHDNMREDLVTLGFHIWSFSLSVVTILNESIPHLGAALASQILATAWSAFRIADSHSLQGQYDKLVVQQACGGFDLLTDWWDIRTNHTIPIIVINAVMLAAMLAISLSLFRVYARQTFSRVGGSQEVLRIYKLVLLFSVFLQLTGFFTLASTGIWIDKISFGAITRVARHKTLYQAAFIVIACLGLPWVILGWISVRRERRKTFLVFSAISLILIVISAMMFASPLYIFVFKSWPFFATITVTSFILMVTTTALGILCRVIGFGKGLAHFLRVQEALEDVNFTPVYFTSDKADAEMAGQIPRFTMMSDEKAGYMKGKMAPMPSVPIPVALPFESERAGDAVSHNTDTDSRSAVSSLFSAPTYTSPATSPSVASHSTSDHIGSRLVSRFSATTATSGASSGTHMSFVTPQGLGILPPVPAAGRSSPTATRGVMGEIRGLPSNPRPRTSSQDSAGQTSRKSRAAPAF